MEQISIFLKRFELIGYGDRIFKKNLIEAIFEAIGEEIQTTDISIQKDKIKINISGPIRSEIFIKKSQIEKNFFEKMKKYNIPTEKKIGK